ncbi:protein RFT1 homolog isoform X1 [Zeugodacus cucurbitae]|uniref:protein RFT1 homolog isoform X1 n=2 Tax=Zeugodacus cucurbitae TaxID=28588 RepID=UPI0005968F59|nr:protein RFT1 homolog isoform X1 [Zeugodacus cucurbitae]
MDRNVLHSSILSGAFSIIFQVLCRILTFGINAFIVRNVGRDVLGIMNVRLLLLESTLLFLSREAFNRAGLSATTQQRNKCSWAQLINQMWLTAPTCIVICIPCVYIWLHLLSPVDDQYKLQYQFGCYAMALSCIVELCAEAPSFVTQVFCFVRVRIVLNTLHILVRSAVFLWIVINDKSVAINAFAIAQLMSTATIIFGNYGFFYFYIRRLNQQKQQLDKKSTSNDMQDFPFTKISEFFPGVMKNEGKFFNTELQILTLSFVKQGVLKQILTEGEKYVMSVSPVLNFSEQATYDVVNNLGSLAARFIFRPIEDSSYFFFTQTIARDVVLYKQSRESVVQAAKVLHNLSLAVTSIGLLALTFGQSYSHTLLLLYGGADFVAGGLPEKLLQWHCLAIYFLAINGITEGYMFATNTSRDIDKYNYLMAIFSVSFLILSYILTSFLGPVGFIFANCINMFCRICYSTHFIYRQYQPTELMPLKGLLPGKWFIITLIITGLFCKYASYWPTSIPVHLLYGFLSVSCCLLVWTIENRELVKLGWRYGQRIKSD